MSNAIAFWEDNLNPISMFSTNTIIKNKEKKDTENVIFLHNPTDEYINHHQVKELFGIGSRSIKKMVLDSGYKVFRNTTRLLYKRKDVEEIYNKNLNQKQQKQAEKENHISNQELMEMFSITGYQAWDIARKEKLQKIRLNRNVIYYEKEKAIEAFSKYKKI